MFHLLTLAVLDALAMVFFLLLLLLQVRVSQPADNERNFHVFYMLCKAAPADVRQRLSLLTRPAGYADHDSITVANRDVVVNEMSDRVPDRACFRLCEYRHERCKQER